MALYFHLKAHGQHIHKQTFSGERNFINQSLYAKKHLTLQTNRIIFIRNTFRENNKNIKERSTVAIKLFSCLHGRHESEQNCQLEKFL